MGPASGKRASNCKGGPITNTRTTTNHQPPEYLISTKPATPLSEEELYYYCRGEDEEDDLDAISELLSASDYAEEGLVSASKNRLRFRRLSAKMLSNFVFK